MKTIILCTLSLALVGCGHMQTQEPGRTVTHQILVPVPCSPHQPDRPVSAVDAIPLEAEIDEQMRALRADRQRMGAYAAQLEQALDTCR